MCLSFLISNWIYVKNDSEKRVVETYIMKSIIPQPSYLHNDKTKRKIKTNFREIILKCQQTQKRMN